VLEPLPLNRTDVDIVIHTRGRGALMIDIPDGTINGGNCRGNQAIDLQSERRQANQVASGNNSAILVGQNNTASGPGSVVLGGQNNTAEGFGAIAGGINTQSRGNASLTFGKAESGGVILADVNSIGSETSGFANNGGIIKTDTYGSKAVGYVNGVGSIIQTARSAHGSKASGSTETASKIQTGGLLIRFGSIWLCIY